MSKPVAYARIATYRELIGLGEGLSFSDYYDDSVPNEVKPVHSLCPMEENKSLEATFIWLEKDGTVHDTDNIQHGLYVADNASMFGVNYAFAMRTFDKYGENGIDEAAAIMCEQAFTKGWLRVVKVPWNEKIFVEGNEPTKAQKQVLEDWFFEDKNKDIIWQRWVSSKFGPPQPIVLFSSENAELNEQDYPIQAKDLFKRVHTEVTKTKNPAIFIVGMKPEQKEEFKLAVAQLFSYLREELKLKTIPSIHLISDATNARKMLGRTGYYDPTNKKICLYITDRHPKDILRSFAHEVIHHWQHENKQLDKFEKKEGANQDPEYAQNDPWMRQMEKQAYLLGNIMFRDWEDGKKADGRKSNKKLAERTLSIGKEYPPKKPDYRG